MKTVKNIKPEIRDLSQKQIDEHFLLYEGYVKKQNELDERMKTIDLSDANATFSLLREIKLEETFASNAIKLHEGYFQNIGGNGNPEGDVKRLIEQDFGSFERWGQEFTSLGMCARGWIVLAFDWDEMKLRNVLCDVHNQGGLWNCTPILILDVYEHAYFVDFATARKKYIETFMKNINWKFINELVKKYKIA